VTNRFVYRIFNRVTLNMIAWTSIVFIPTMLWIRWNQVDITREANRSTQYRQCIEHKLDDYVHSEKAWFRTIALAEQIKSHIPLSNYNRMRMDASARRLREFPSYENIQCS